MVMPHININCTIFQGALLSPLIIFFSVLITLTRELNRTGHVYKIGDKNISNLFYIDDFKIYGKDDNELERLL